VDQSPPQNLAQNKKWCCHSHCIVDTLIIQS
jgi:hypothetical protein